MHAELILVHPLRAGIGRIARVLAMLMGLQAVLPPLDFSPLEGRGKKRYFAGFALRSIATMSCSPNRFRWLSTGLGRALLPILCEAFPAGELRGFSIA